MDTCINADESQKNAEWKRPDRKDIVPDSIFMTGKLYTLSDSGSRKDKL